MLRERSGGATKGSGARSVIKGTGGIVSIGGEAMDGKEGASSPATDKAALIAVSLMPLLSDLLKLGKLSKNIRNEKASRAVVVV